MRWLPLFVVIFFPLLGRAERPFTVAAYNLQNYLLQRIGTRPAKSPEARAKIAENLATLKPDVLAIEEIGDTNALFAFQADLKRAGLDLPHWEHVRGWDTNIFVAVLSRFPIVARRSHTTDSYLLSGRRFHVSRGFAEVEIAVNDHYRFTLLAAHLKSRRPVPQGDQAEMREQEAILLREKIDARLKADPTANVVVVGDFNDVKDSRSIRAIIGRGKAGLLDTRPAERNGDTLAAERPGWDPATVTWTHFYGKEDSYSRIDYILVSPGMAKEWRKEGTYVLTAPNWGLASDHRPIIAEFVPKDAP
jgi:endonuclease/exonuclease/phosphatase family metal-dependent hydrolase